MERIVSSILFGNWQRKIIALVVAVIVWIFVNQSITSTKTIPGVPVRVLNIPQDKTISGLLPNGYLSQRMTVTLSGTKDIIEQVEPGDLEVRIDAANADAEDWVVQLSKKNIISLDPSLDIAGHLKTLGHSEFIVKLSNLVTEKIPVLINAPEGKAPAGYELLDIWPQKLTQTLSGPEEEMDRLKIKGLKLTFDLNHITKEELDALKRTNQHAHNDEVSFPVPKRWKKVAIPFRKYAPEELNDPEAEFLRIDFLRKRLIPLDNPLQVKAYFPQKTSADFNPLNTTFELDDNLTTKNGIYYFMPPVYVKEVSRLFLDIVKENLVLVIIVSSQHENDTLQWTLEVIDSKEMEDAYVATLLKEMANSQDESNSQQREKILRNRFRNYLQNLSLYNVNEEYLKIKPTLIDHRIIIKSLN